MKKISLILLLLSSVVAFSQTKSFEINGKVFSKTDNTPIESATVYLQRVIDSTIITYNISDSKGDFILENKTKDANANLYISYIGYKTYSKKITLDKQKIMLGNILLEENTNALEAVVIKAQVPPIVVKKDTLEFNVKSFKTKKDANVEDLLKELPGVEVTDDGKIKINGKEVNKILVNGKPFFSGDLSIATKNLTKDIIEKIQVSDTKTDEQAFTGEEGSKTNKTINLVIKKENNKGEFGRLAAGAGTDDKYQYAGMYNRFDNDQRLSLLAGGNNVNEPGFSYGEINKMFGGSAQNVNSQLNNWSRQGIITSNNSGLNFVDTWGKNVDVSTDYFGSNTNTLNEQKSETEHLIPDNLYFSKSDYNSNKESGNYSSNSKIKIKLDSTLLITITPEFSYSKNTETSTNNSASFNLDNDSINKYTSDNLSTDTNKKFSNNFNITKRFGKKGSFLKFYMYNSFSNKDSESFVKNDLKVFEDAAKDSITNQFKDGENKSSTFVLETKYRATFLEKKLKLNLGIGYRKNIQKNVKNAFDFNETTDAYENFINDDFSTDFQYENITTTPSVELEYKKDKWSTSLKTEYLIRTLENSDFLRTQFSLKQNFNAPQLNYRLNYRNPKTSFSLSYNLRNEAPSLSQIQPFVNISNPSNTIIGNPNLSPTKTHSIRLNFSNNNFQKGNSFYAYISSSIDEDQIVRKSIIDSEALTRVTTYANVNGQYSLYGYTNYDKKIKIDSVKTINLGAGLGSNIRKSVNFINNIQYSSTNNTVYPNITARFNWKDVGNIRISYRPSYTKTIFDTDLFDKQEIIRQNIDFRTSNFFTKKLEFSNEIRYTHNPSISDGFDKSSWFWNATLSYSLLKDKALLSIKAFDILNQNISAWHYAYQNQIVDYQSNVLQQYFMLSFSWKFNSLGKKGRVRNYK